MDSNVTANELFVVKVGGSLYDLGDLGERLERWLKTLPTRRVLLVPGGGLAADVVRTLDRIHGLGEEKAHWLALRALSLNAHFLAEALPSAVVVSEMSQQESAWSRGHWPILDCYAFAIDDESRTGRLPHRWAVTSDSLAARVAVVCAARQLVLLKSVALPPDLDWNEASRQGFVDAAFSTLVPFGLVVAVVNLRSWSADPPPPTP